MSNLSSQKFNSFSNSIGTTVYIYIPDESVRGQGGNFKQAGYVGVSDETNLGSKIYQ